MIRAIARASGDSWEDTLTGLFRVGLRVKSELAYKDCYEKYLGEQGWLKHIQPRKEDGTKYTVAEWCRKHRHATMVVSVANHLTCIIGVKCNDIWDCTGMTVLNYWTKV